MKTKTFLSFRRLALAGTAALVTLLGAPAVWAQTYGNTTDNGGSSSVLANTLLGEQVYVNQSATLNDFDAIFRMAGTNVNFGLYSSTSSNTIQSPPSQLLATTGSHAITSTGLVSIPFTQTTTIPAGYYWIMAVYDANTNVGQTGGASPTMSGTLIDYRSFGYSDTLPQTFGAVTSYSGVDLDYAVSTNPVVPEPSTWAGGALLLGAGVLTLRRRTRFSSRPHLTFPGGLLPL